MQEIKNVYAAAKAKEEKELKKLRAEIAAIEHSDVDDVTIIEEAKPLEVEPEAPLTPGEDLTKYSFEELTLKAAIRGYIKGLEAEGIDMDALPGNFATLLEDPSYELPTWLWEELISWDYDQQAQASYPIYEEVHLWRALRAIQIGSGPLGILRGREHLALKLELSGKFHFERLAEELHPLMVRFTLDKGATQDLANAGSVAYPRSVKLFLARRRALCQEYGLDSYDKMARFIAGGSVNAGWPRELSAPFADNLNLLLDAINQMAIHYW